MGWGGGGLLTKKMEQGKRNKLVIFFDILVIIAFILFALSQRWEYDAGYMAAYTQICSNGYGGLNSDTAAQGICFNIMKAKAQAANMTPEEWIKIQYPPPPPCNNQSWCI